MNVRRTSATARRVLSQLGRDHRTVALMLVVPGVLLGLLAWVFEGTAVFDRVGAPLLGVFPFVVMFLVTSVATLRERSSGTLERLLTMPLGRLDLLLGYALAFGLLAVVQALLTTAFAVTVLGLDVAGPLALLVGIAILDALLGTALGLLVSAFAATEFQAVQFMPAFVLPQFLLSGLLVPRPQLDGILHAISDALPLSYAVDAMVQVVSSPELTAGLVADLAVVTGSVLVALALGAATLRRRTA